MPDVNFQYQLCRNFRDFASCQERGMARSRMARSRMARILRVPTHKDNRLTLADRPPIAEIGEPAGLLFNLIQYHPLVRAMSSHSLSNAFAVNCVTAIRAIASVCKPLLLRGKCAL
jgi:hypothetical protein